MATLSRCPFCPSETRPQPLMFGMCKYHFEHPGECKKAPPGPTVIITDIKLPGVKKASDKRAGETKQYLKLRKVFLEANPACMARLEGCTRHAEAVHHKAGREGRLLLDVSKWLPICNSCHLYVTESSSEAVELGLSESRHKG